MELPDQRPRKLRWRLAFKGIFQAVCFEFCLGGRQASREELSRDISELRTTLENERVMAAVRVCKEEW
ncbi:hypothetical protein CCACVL1_25461 [Corchorus capsularis]|uniref:Uncharacterized protein n=1 Tax=Corchorus capsularis TaxID=210143 RepID=A0A1R3GJZ1_COCAP|nr:hypothetical protein CCACVL1_25461 [Corchorus capsularis]